MPTSDRGQSTVELALLLPIVGLLLLAVLQAGLVARDVVLVAHASREAARAAAVDNDPAAARRAALASSGLHPERLEVVVRGRGGPGSRVQVEVAYRTPTNVPIIGTFLGDRVLRSAATMRVEGRGYTTICANRHDSDKSPAHTRDFCPDRRPRRRIREVEQRK